MTALLPAELAWYATGRFYRAEDGALADYGYFLHLPFAEAPLFDGDPAETTAHFTFAATPFKARAVANGALSLGLDPVGEFSLYLQRRPAASFDDPASFARGECIATFRRTSLAVGTTVAATHGGTTAAPVGTNVFSARLVASSPFEFGDGRHDLAHHLGRGITQFGTAAATPVLPPPGYDLVLPFTGSAIALGRVGRGTGSGSIHEKSTSIRHGRAGFGRDRHLPLAIGVPAGKATSSSCRRTAGT